MQNNLKKILALSLAATSILGTVTMASFTDQKEIQATDAVDTLVALKIIKGYEDGSFKPTANITRAELAKMIFTVQNGGSDDASAFVGISSSFQDVKGHWAEGYIKYCQSQGIIAGKSDTKFDPNTNVKGVEALKMSLVLLGYRPDKSELVGANWASNTLVLSTKAGITEDYIGDVSSDSQRQAAAQIIYNALYTETVKYSAMFEEYQGTDETLAESAMNLKTIENVYVKDSDIDGGVTFTTDSQLTTEHTDSALDSERDLTSYIGQKVEILADIKTDEVYGVKPYDVNEVIRTYASNITISNEGSSKVAEFDDVEINITDEDATLIQGTDDNSLVYIVNNGTTVTTDITEVAVGEVTFVNKDKINVSATGYTGGQLQFDEDNIPKDIKKDDFVQVTEDDFTNNQTVKVLNKQEGTVQAKRDSQFKVDGKWVSIATGDKNPKLNSEISYYDVGTVIYGVKAIEKATGDYAFVVGAEKAGDGFEDQHRAKLVFEDGTTKIVVTEVDETAKIGKIVSYDETDGEYTLDEVDTAKDFDVATLSGNIYNQDSKKLGGSYVSDDALIFVSYDDDKFTVITGKQVKEWDDVGIVADGTNLISYTNPLNGINYVEMAFVDLGANKLPNEVGTEQFGYVVDDSYEIKVENEIYTVVTIFDGKEVREIKAESAEGITKGDYVSFELNADGEIANSIVEVVGLNADQVTGYNKSTGVILFKTAGEVEIDEDTIIIYVDSEENVGVEGGSIILADDMTGDDVVENNVRVATNNGKVTIMYVDVNNNMK